MTVWTYIYKTVWWAFVELLRERKFCRAILSFLAELSGDFFIWTWKFILVVILFLASCTFLKMTSTPIVTITRREVFSAAHRLHRFASDFQSTKFSNKYLKTILLASIYHRRRIAKSSANATMPMATATITQWKFRFAGLSIAEREWWWTLLIWKKLWNIQSWNLSTITTSIKKCLILNAHRLQLRTSRFSFGKRFATSLTSRSYCTKWNCGKLIRISLSIKEKNPCLGQEYVKTFALTCRPTRSDARDLRSMRRHYH